MQPLRHARFLARLVLAWFVLALGAAAAAPIVQPQATELVCSAGGAMKLIVKGDDGGKEVKSHTLDCPLCATLSAPPPAIGLQTEPPHALAHALRPIAAVHLAARTAAPLPARGPPSSSI